jgi:hypothetical protein
VPFKDAVRDRFQTMRKEFYKTIDKFMPKKLLHMTIHDAVLHALEQSKKKK